MSYMIIDGNSIINRAFYATPPLTNSKGVYTNAIYGFLNIYFKFFEEENPKGVAVAFDLKAPTFRHKQYEDYKKGRHQMPDELASQLPLLKDLLTKMNIKILELEGYEADDIIGTISSMCSEKKEKCTIITGDRDSLQLINEYVTVKLPSNAKGKPITKLYNLENFISEYEITPLEFIDTKALMGDSSDNIPGVKGIGEKTALSLIQKYKTIDNLYDNIDDDFIKKGQRQKLILDKENAYMSKDLATICLDVPLNIELSNLDYDGYDNEIVLKEFLEYNFKKLIEKLNLKSEPMPKFEEKKQNIIEVSSDDFYNLAKKEKRVYLYLHKNEDAQKSLFEEKEDLLFGKCKSPYIISGDINNLLLKLIQDEDVEVFAFDLLEIYKRIYYKDLTPKNIVFDFKICEYVLDSSTKDTVMENLLLKYLDINVLDFNQYVVYLDALSEKMLEKCSEINSLYILNEIEIPLIFILLDMEKEGFKVDKENLVSFGENLKSNIKNLEDSIYDLAGEKFNINSPKQLGVVLFERLQLPIVKKTKTGYSTNADVLEKLRDEHEIISYIEDYRQLEKLRSTYVDGLLPLLDEENKIHSIFKQTVTQTGRLSSTEPNLQNIPIRTELGSYLRKMFIASDDNNVLLDADYSQIELRILAAVSNDPVMINAFNQNIDIHSVTASQVFGVDISDVDQTLRRNAKAVNFGIVYGIGEFSLAIDIGVSRKEAKEYIDKYFEKYKNVKEFLDNTVEEATKNGYTKTILGRIRYIPELKNSNKMIQKFGQRAAMNAPIQGAAADIMKIAMINVFNRLKKENLKTKLILQVHDELILDSPLEEKEKASIILKEEMENAVKLSVNLDVSVSSGKTWYDTKN